MCHSSCLQKRYRQSSRLSPACFQLFANNHTLINLLPFEYHINGRVVHNEFRSIVGNSVVSFRGYVDCKRADKTTLIQSMSIDEF